MKTSIALIGFMGTGKTVVGKALAEKLGKEFIELDALIERKAGKTIPQIFRQDGEIGFRSIEIEVAREASGRKNAVIACGGGIVLNQINIDRLKQKGVVVYLRASPEVVLRRTAEGGNQRPLLAVADPGTRVRELLGQRRPFYERAADISVNTSALSIERVAETVIRRVGKYAGKPT